MSVNLYETPITPIVDLDSDVVVYVPGYAQKGPLEPTLVTADTFASIFGEAPYTFSGGDDTSTETYNTLERNAPDRGWLYAKGLLDSGLTVLYHRIPDKASTAYATTEEVRLYTKPVFTSSEPEPEEVLSESLKIRFRAKFPGSYYSNFSVSVGSFSRKVQKLTVYLNGEEVQSRSVSFNPEDPFFIGKSGLFDNIELVFYRDGKEVSNVAEVFELFDIYQPAEGSTAGYVRIQTPAETTKEGETLKASYTLSMPKTSSTEPPAPEFTVSTFLTNLGTKLDDLLDTDTYPTVTYITSGGYYQTATLAQKMLAVAANIRAIALIDFSDSVDSIQTALEEIGADTTEYIKGAAFVGANTFKIYGDSRIMADSYGYLTKLGKNLSQAIPAWIPVANVPQGVTTAVATTRAISFAARATLIPADNRGIAVNPIVYKQNSGYTIMGNRTLAKLNGVTGPDAFLNCQLVVNSVLRAARRAASDLLIVSTSPATAFSTFCSVVSKTCDKMMVNGDGLAAYNITKLKKTKPATIDIQIALTLVEGIETFNIYVPYEIALDA